MSAVYFGADERRGAGEQTPLIYVGDSRNKYLETTEFGDDRKPSSSRLTCFVVSLTTFCALMLIAWKVFAPGTVTAAPTSTGMPGIPPWSASSAIIPADAPRNAKPHARRAVVLPTLAPTVVPATKETTPGHDASAAIPAVRSQQQAAGQTKATPQPQHVTAVHAPAPAPNTSRATVSAADTRKKSMAHKIAAITAHSTALAGHLKQVAAAAKNNTVAPPIDTKKNLTAAAPTHEAVSTNHTAAAAEKTTAKKKNATATEKKNTFARLDSNTTSRNKTSVQPCTGDAQAIVVHMVSLRKYKNCADVYSSGGCAQAKVSKYCCNTCDPNVRLAREKLTQKLKAETEAVKKKERALALKMMNAKRAAAVAKHKIAAVDVTSTKSVQEMRESAAAALRQSMNSNRQRTAKSMSAALNGDWRSFMKGIGVNTNPGKGKGKGKVLFSARAAPSPAKAQKSPDAKKKVAPKKEKVTPAQLAMEQRFEKSLWIE